MKPVRQLKLLKILCITFLLLICSVVQAQQANSTVKLGGDFRLTNHHGKSFELQQMRGKVVLLFFGYTWCPTVCPESLTQMAQVLRELDDQADEVGVLFVSVDPERDTAEKLGQYVPYFNPRLIGLTGSVAEIKQVTQAYRAVYTLQKKSPDDEQYTIDHTADIYALDRQGNVASIIPFGMPAQHIVSVVRQMLNEESVLAEAPTPDTSANAESTEVTAQQSSASETIDKKIDKKSLPVYTGKLKPPVQRFQAQDLQGNLQNMATYAGKPVLINFWASWCPPCRAELPALNRAAVALQADGISTLAVNVGDSKTAVTEFLQDFPIDFPLLLDEKGDSMMQWDIKGMPTTVLLNEAGQVAFHVAGEREWDSKPVLAQIRKLAGQQR